MARFNANADVDPVAASTFPLSHRSQTRNIIIYATSLWLLYLAAPVLYVGLTQAALCNRLGASDAVANLPGSAFYWTSALPIIIAGRFHTVCAIKPVLATCGVVSGLAGLFVAAALWLPMSSEVRIATVVLHGVLIGGAATTGGVFLWDMLNRGVEVSRRGTAFSLAFGVGPIFAVVGSVASQLILAGRIELPWPSPSGMFSLHTVTVPSLEFPNNFAVVFAASGPIMLTAAVLVTFVVLPVPNEEPPRQRLLPNLLSGFREIVGDRILLTAVLAYLAMCCGGTIVGNMSLFTTEALGRPPEDFAGVQNALRFGFKIVAGFMLGWLLAKTNAKMGMLATGGLTLLGIVWLLIMPRQWFLVTFGLMGAGELYGVYYPNYVISRSRPERVRLNMAFVGLVAMLISFAPATFGAISDRFGLPTSFVAAACLVGVSVALVLSLPANARPLDRRFDQTMPEETEPRNRTHRTTLLLYIAVIALVSAAPVRAAVDFESEVKPIFEASCHRCHNQENADGDVRLDSLKNATAKNDRGPVLVPRDPAKFNDFYIHQIDEISWMKNAWPVRAQALGGRHYRGDNVDQNFDAYAVEYTFEDGSHFFFDGRTMTGCRNEMSSVVHGAKGAAIVSTSGHYPGKVRTFKEQNQDRAKLVWAYPQPEESPYLLEWRDLIEAIVRDEPYNEVPRGVEASVVTSMGRMAAHTGQEVTYEQRLNCRHEMAPGVADFAIGGPAPVTANPDGTYPVPMPGLNREREYETSV